MKCQVTKVSKLNIKIDRAFIEKAIKEKITLENKIIISDESPIKFIVDDKEDARLHGAQITLTKEED